MLFRIAPRGSLREGPVLTELPAQAHNSGSRAQRSAIRDILLRHDIMQNARGRAITIKFPQRKQMINEVSF